ncbi:hypothetical protein [Butyrivibrio sp. AE3009]|uniref:hypothetical protein n=1 Tax=Butyrivibrio sp. AE3009 TaxID=1280666 RepID=UPI000407F0F2|nr:hypothetical protein [Butyrivibrio sp. AE3009]
MMRKNNLFEKKTISALVVGISAMMALSAPITAYAEGEEAPETSPTEPETQQSAVAEAEPVTTAPAQEQAEVAKEAIENIISEVAPITTEETAASEEDGGAVAEEAVEDVIEAAQAIEEAVQEAVTDIQNAEEDLKVAEKADVAEQEAAREVVQIIQEAEVAADVVEQTVADAKTEAETINQAIDQAVEDKNEEKANEELQKLETLIDQAQEVVEERQTELEQLNKDYTNAKAELRKAEKDYLEALTDASADVNEAKAKLEEAKAEADNLKDAVETAQEKLEAESVAAQDLKDELENNRQNWANWDKQGELLKAYILDYYIPQVLGTDDETSVKFEKKVKGFDRQDYTYYEFSYTDKDGNKVTKYFNLDRVDKQVCSDPYNKLGSSKEIVIFEKSELEVGADTYLRQLYSNETWYEKGVVKGVNSEELNTVKDKMRQGDFRVYSYEKDGVTYYIAQEQLDGNKPETRKIEVDQDGTIKVEGCVITEVIQNKNSNTHGNPAIIGNTQYITTGEEETDNEVAQFIKEADSYVEKYKEYSDAVTNAEDATAQAKEEVEKLADAIEDLKTRDNYVLTAAEALGVTDVAKFLGIEVPEEVDMNSMTIEEAIGYLDKLLDKANEKMEDAIQDLSALTSQKEAAKQVINDLAKESQINPAVVINEINNQIEDEQKETEEDKKDEENKEEKDEEDNGKEEELKEEEKEEVLETEDKKDTSKKRTPAPAAENNEDSAPSDEANTQSDAVAFNYEPTQEWTIIFSTIDNTVMDEAAIPQPTQPVLGPVTTNTGWTEGSIIDLVNDIAEEKETETELESIAAPSMKVANKKDNNKAPVTISEEAVPLAAGIPVEAEKDSQISWWWLLIIAVLGITGEEMYKKRKEKELEENTQK